MAASLLITGGNGFLGHHLARFLLDRPVLVSEDQDGEESLAAASLSPRDLLILDIASPSPSHEIRGANYVCGDVTDASLLEKIIDKNIRGIFHLSAVLSGEAEENFDLGMRVNVDGTRALIDACRKAGHCPTLVLASSVAVFGHPPAPEFVFSESSSLYPQSSYGTEKAICELIINDASRRGFVNGRAVRLPTIVVRPGKPNSATSSFCSSIIREPLKGEKAVCPVPPETPLWVMSPKRAIENLVHALGLHPSNPSRIITLPGLQTSPSEMVDSLARRGFDPSLVQWEANDHIMRVVCTWPGFIATPHALKLGFKPNLNVDEILEEYITNFMQSKVNGSS